MSSSNLDSNEYESLVCSGFDYTIEEEPTGQYPSEYIDQSVDEEYDIVDAYEP